MKLHPTIKNLIGDERGNVLMTFGLTSMVAVAAIGGALDFGRAYHHKSKMQNALDAAVVSGVAKYRESNDWAAATTEASAIFSAVFNNAVSPTTSVPNPTAALDQPLVTFTQSGTQLAGSAIMTANTPFMNLVIGSNLTVSANSSAVPPDGKMLEVALMVDLTGSMGWSAAAGSTATSCASVANPTKKIDYLKCAADDLFNILLPTSGANSSSVKIGVAPFADYVNAGEYASAVTGLASTGGTYSNVANLAQTKQGTFSGTYSGWTAGTGTGNQFGAMGATATAGSTTSAAGATYNSGYCSTTTTTTTAAATTTTVAIAKYSGYRTGERISREYGVSDPVDGLIYVASNATNADKFKHIDDVDGEGTNWIDYDDDLKTGYFAARPESTTGLTIKQRTANSGGSSKTGNVGAKISVEDDYNEANVLSLGFKKATNSSGYWRFKTVKDSGDHEYEWTTSGYYLPIYDSFTVTTPGATVTVTIPGCESTVSSQPSSKLISCVTERVSGTTLNYTAAAPSTGNYIGAYNHGLTSKSNYSSDGKCNVAGRELPAVIPLTNSRTTLDSFVDNATVGGATPGHLGTAWASYLLSPDWSSIWPSSSQPSAYNSTTTTKAAILMTDGEYNLQFTGSATNSSAKQALMLCKQMRDNGIKVYTVGFGFAENATPPTTNVEGMTDTERTTPAGLTATNRALDVLAKCASTNSSYYFPYDGESLRTTFKSIANGLSSDINGGKARITN